MEKVRTEIEDLMEEILDQEAEKGELDSLTSRFSNVLMKMQEEQAELAAKEARDKVKQRLCAVLDASPDLRVNELNLVALEDLVRQGNPYRREIGADALIAGQQVLQERIQRQQQQAAPARWDQVQAFAQMAQPMINPVRAPAGGVRFFMDEAPGAGDVAMPGPDDGF